MTCLTLPGAGYDETDHVITLPQHRDHRFLQLAHLLPKAAQMLKKFIEIKNVGTFRNSRASGDVELRKLNLVHADNGRGKTTLCAILRSLQSGDAQLLLERKTLDSEGSPHVEVRTDSDNITFDNGAWQSIYPQIEVFDTTFVAENVYSGDRIDHDHKRNLCRIVLGAKGVKLAGTFDRLDDELKTAAAEITQAEKVVQVFLPKAVTIQKFVELHEDPEINAKLTQKRAELAVLEDADAIHRKPQLLPITLPHPPSNLSELLGKTLGDVSADVEQKVKDHITQHAMNHHGETWLSEGLKYTTDETCPFCAQSLQTSEIISSFRAFFSEAYNSLKQEIATLESQFGVSLSEATYLAVEKKLLANTNAYDFWQKHGVTPVPTISYDEQLRPVLTALHKALSPLVKAKLASPLASFEYPPTASAAIAAWTQLSVEITAYNNAVAAANIQIVAVKARIATKTLDAVKKELADLELQYLRVQPTSVVALKTLADAKAIKTKKDSERTQAREALDAHEETVVGKYRGAVNEILKRFAAAFTLDLEVEYVGRTPRTACKFVLRGKRIEPGNDKTAPGTPCFRNTLSSGDRNTLALAFFLAQLRVHESLSDLVVVFDDPFTSLDVFRQTWTCHAIRNLAAKQIIVLSHSLDFLQLLANHCKGGDIKTLRIEAHGEFDSRIVALDLANAAAPGREQDIIQLRSFYLSEDKDSRKTIRCIRPILENYIRGEAPDECPSETGWLGDFLGDIRNAQDPSPLARLKVRYDDFAVLNNYTAPFHHDPNQESPIDDTELRSNARLTLEIIGRL